MMSRRLITRADLAEVRRRVGIAFSVRARTQALRGDESSSLPRTEEIPSQWKPSIERSVTNSTASITVPANPHRPLVYSVEPLSGSERLLKLTVLYEPWADDSVSHILKSVESASTQEPTILEGVDDPRWLDRIARLRENG
jgi:hypothetical protein